MPKDKSLSYVSANIEETTLNFFVGGSGGVAGGVMTALASV